MAGSLDFLYDCLDGMEKQKQEYILIVLNKASKGKNVQANVAINVSNKKNIRLMRNTMRSVDLELAENL